MRHGPMHHALFHALCELVNALVALEEDMPASRHQYALHALIHRFDAMIDLLVELEWPGQSPGSGPGQALPRVEPGGSGPANDDQAPLGPEETPDAC